MLASGDILQTIAEVGAAFAGFAALVTAIAVRGVRGRSIDLTRLHIAVGGALMVIVAGVVPFAVAAYEPHERVVWRVSAGAVLAINYSYILIYVPWVRRVRGGGRDSLSGLWFFWVLEAAFQLPLLVVLLGFTPGLGQPLYITGVVFLLCQGAVLFLTLVTSIASTLIGDEPAA